MTDDDDDFVMISDVYGCSRLRRRCGEYCPEERKVFFDPSPLHLSKQDNGVAIQIMANLLLEPGGVIGIWTKSDQTHQISLLSSHILVPKAKMNCKGILC